MSNNYYNKERETNELKAKIAGSEVSGRISQEE